MRMTKRLGLISTLVLLALTVSGCGQGSLTRANSDPSVITYMEFSSNGGHEQDLNGAVKEFEKENPGLTVQVQTVPYSDYYTTLQTALAGGTGADVFELDYSGFASLATSGALAPIEDVNTSVYQPSLLDAYQIDGKQYGLPESYSDELLFYNKDLFDAAGVAYPTSTWTWADEQAAAKKLTDPANGVWGDFQPITFNEFYKALTQAGGSFFNADKTKATFDSPQGVKAATWLTQKSGTTMPTEADGASTPDFDTNLFKEGKLAMWHTGNWMFPELADAKDLNWDVVVEPGDVNQTSAMFANGVAINAKTSKTEGATKWAQFLTSSTYMANMRVRTGWELPPLADESVLQPYLDQTPPDNRQAVVDALDSTVITPEIPQQQQMEDTINSELSNAAAGRKTVPQALHDAQASVNSLLTS